MMRGYLTTLAGCAIWLHGVAALYHAPQETVTATSTASLDARGPILVQAPPYRDYGFIGIKPRPNPTAVNLEEHSKYLTKEKGTTKGVLVTGSKSEGGGLDILLSPAVKAKLEKIAKSVTPCAKKRRRTRSDVRKRQPGKACGLADFVQRVGKDEGLQEHFAEPLTDQVWEVDSGYGNDHDTNPANDPGWEGDGDPGWESDEGYFSDDDTGFFEGAEGAEGGEAEGVLETVVFGTEEEAAAIGKALSAAELAKLDAAIAVWGTSTMTAGSFLASLWGTLAEGKALANAEHIPKEKIHTATKTKNKNQTKTKKPDIKTTATATTSSSSSCPTGKAPACKKGCVPASVEHKQAKATGMVDWFCSKGDHKDCRCNPEVVKIVQPTKLDVQKIVDSFYERYAGQQKEPDRKTECPGNASVVPSKWFLDKTSVAFCKDVMGDLKQSRPAKVYDIKGHSMVLLKSRSLDGPAVDKRTPPEDIDEYMSYKIFLTYEPLGGDCQVDKKNLCKNAYKTLIESNCGSNHGSAGDRLSRHATIDVGCANFGWFVKGPGEQDGPGKKARDTSSEDDEGALAGMLM